MEKDKVVTIELDERFDRIVVENIVCPNPDCRSKYITHVPYVNLSCGKCGTRFTTTLNQDMYTKIARKIISNLAYNNTLKFKVNEKYEGDVTNIKNHFDRMLSYDVSDIKNDYEEHRRCEKCGTCTNCFTCKKCGKTFEKNPNRRKQTCPHCHSNSYVYTYFQEVFQSDKNLNIRLCPFCKSDKIVMTRSKLKSKCHICGSKKMSDKIIERIFLLTIKRKPAYKVENYHD